MSPELDGDERRTTPRTRRRQPRAWNMYTGQSSFEGVQNPRML